MEIPRCFCGQTGDAEFGEPNARYVPKTLSPILRYNTISCGIIPQPVGEKKFGRAPVLFGDRLMTWFSSHIYAEPTQSVIGTFSVHPAASKGIYLLTNPIEHDWAYPQSRHELPENGLLVVREVCNPAKDDVPFNPEKYESRWHGDKTISWDNFVGPNDIEVILPSVLPVRLGVKVDVEFKTRSYPPTPLLRFLKHLNLTTHTAITYYHHETAANHYYEQEFAWVFDEEDKVYVRYGSSQILQHTFSGSEYLPPIDSRNHGYSCVLGVVLARYGITLKFLGYFAPHTRNFDWDKYRLSSQR